MTPRSKKLELSIRIFLRSRSQIRKTPIRSPDGLVEWEKKNWVIKIVLHTSLHFKVFSKSYNLSRYEYRSAQQLWVIRLYSMVFENNWNNEKNEWSSFDISIVCTLVYNVSLPCFLIQTPLSGVQMGRTSMLSYCATSCCQIGLQERKPV